MARNGTGTYTLPAGNPFITGSVISSTTMNNTLSDIAAALTASVANDGQTPILANQNFGGYNLTNVGTLGAVTLNTTSLVASGSASAANMTVTSAVSAANITVTSTLSALNVIVTGAATVPTVGGTNNSQAAATTAWVRGYAPSGVYNPTTGPNSNVITAATPYGLYTRVGNIVHVQVRFGTTPSGVGACSFQFTLPINSNIGAVSEVVGTGYSLNSLAVDSVAVQGVIGNPGKVQVSWTASGTTAGYANINFAYEVH